MSADFMNRDGPRARSGDGDRGKPAGRNLINYVEGLFRLDMIREAFLSKEPLSRGTRDSHFVEAWLYAVSKEDMPKKGEDGYKPHICLSRSLAFVRRMRELSPHEGGKQIEVLRDVLASQPANVTLVGSPYDTAPPGPFDKAVQTITGKKQEDRIRYNTR